MSKKKELDLGLSIDVGVDGDVTAGTATIVGTVGSSLLNPVEESGDMSAGTATIFGSDAGSLTGSSTPVQEAEMVSVGHLQIITNSSVVISAEAPTPLAAPKSVTEVLVEALSSTSSDHLLKEFQAMMSRGYRESIALRLTLDCLPIDLLIKILTPENVLLFLGKLDKGGIYRFSNKLFSLPKDVIESIVVGREKEMLEAADGWSDYFQFKLLQNFPDTLLCPNAAGFFLLKMIKQNSSLWQTNLLELLFKLPKEQLAVVINSDEILELFNASDDQLTFVHKLLETFKAEIGTILTPVNMKEIFQKLLLKADKFSTQDIEHFLKAFETYGIKIPIEVNKELHFSCHHHSTMFLKLVAPAIHYVEPVRILDPIVKKLLEKTYIQVDSHEAGKKFTEGWIGGLEKIIAASKPLKVILENAAEQQGDIFIANNAHIARGGGHFIYYNSAILIAGNGCNPLSTLVHEATHKLIQNIYKNQCLPYAPAATDKLFESVAKAMEQELLLGNKFLLIDKLYLHQDLAPSWLQTMNMSYNKDSLPSELFAWFTTQIADHILEIPAIGSRVSKGFAACLWDYMNQHLTKLGDSEILPKFCYPEGEEEGSII